MGFLRSALIGAAVYATIKYLTKKDEFTGKSIVDDIREKVKSFNQECVSDEYTTLSR